MNEKIVSDETNGGGLDHLEKKLKRPRALSRILYGGDENVTVNQEGRLGQD